jgi:16S rRNA (guanine527-N7)-methyltransferase
MSSSDTCTPEKGCEAATEVGQRRLVLAEFERIGLYLGGAEAGAFVHYAALLERWGRRVNLTAITGFPDVVHRHFLDSALVLSHVSPRPGDAVADVGSGAGFPGVPLAILRPDVRFSLFEATAKKAAFLHALVATLGLRNVAVETCRLEAARVPPEWRGVFDGVVSRYTAPLTWLVRCARALLRPVGWLVAHRFEGGADEALLARLRSAGDVERAEWAADARAVPRRCFARVWFAPHGRLEPGGRGEYDLE